MAQNTANISRKADIDISVLVPVMNEAGNIRPLIDEIVTVMNGRTFEIIYIDDASTDATADELSDSQRAIPQLRVLRHAKRAGQSAALRSGLLAANGYLIAVLDGDGQNVPSDFPALEAALLADYPERGMAAGIRQKRKDTALKLQASRIAKWIRKALLGDTHPDSGCGIKILHRDLFIELPFFNHMHRFMPSLVRRHGGGVTGVAVAHRARTQGQSKYKVLDRLVVGISDIMGVIWLLKRAPRHDAVIEIAAPKRSQKRPNPPKKPLRTKKGS
ncbi:glycosyltransferase [Candidatus Puniceispirillum marinum]|uniref:Glycosyl transferase, group 2 family protein n=1 Tax=Puniceispirillum marinum (strain IMCC1322) TaxID=488538 RepID=D5BTX6_PUNMI|nr:glycosyltransferase [Candidatus Puniceispirillum marinum]ADE39723.1 glycosyl transferase, group 2 family protein [Candidatus Puniceispirillum marinum IMCC1322]